MVIKADGKIVFDDFREASQINGELHVTVGNLGSKFTGLCAKDKLAVAVRLQYLEDDCKAVYAACRNNGHSKGPMRYKDLHTLNPKSPIKEFMRSMCSVATKLLNDNGVHGDMTLEDGKNLCVNGKRVTLGIVNRNTGFDFGRMRKFLLPSGEVC